MRKSRGKPVFRSTTSPIRIRGRCGHRRLNELQDFGGRGIVLIDASNNKALKEHLINRIKRTNLREIGGWVMLNALWIPLTVQDTR